MLQGIKGTPKAYFYQITTDENLPEEQWESFLAFNAKFLYTGLRPGTKYYFRVKLTDSKGQNVYTSIESKIAL
jgi:hypothetical protein